MERIAGGLLYVVATPIGNADDLSPRAVRILREADLIACEDTRRTGRLLADHGIGTRMVSYFEHNETQRSRELIDNLRAGRNVALVSDAGTPTISDPGYRLVRAALEAGIRVTAVPGPSALIAALSVAGLPTDRFVFEGFLPPRGSALTRAISRLRGERRTMVFYEAARRLVDTLQAMAAEVGSDRAAVVLREISKIHEESRRGRLDELIAHFKATAPLGEVTIVVAGEGEETELPQTSEAAGGLAADEAAAITILRKNGLSLRDSCDVIAKLTRTRKRDVYQRAVLNKEAAPEAPRKDGD